MASENRDHHGRFARTEASMLKDQEALALRLKGYSLAQIAQELEVSVAAAHRMVQRGLKDAAPARAVEELRAEQAEQIDFVIRSLWPHVARGSARHAEVLLKALERQARLFGLDAPQEQVVEVLTADVLDRAIRELEAEIIAMGGEVPPELVEGEGEEEC
jgi:transposase